MKNHTTGRANSKIFKILTGLFFSLGLAVACQSLKAQPDGSDIVNFKSGPVVPDFNAEHIIDDFESETPKYVVRTRGNPSYKISNRPGISHGGNSSLLINITPPEVEGYHVVDIVWSFDPPLDMSKYDGITFHHQSLDDDWRSYNVIAAEEGGALYKNWVEIKPAKAGEWQTIHLDNKNWAWFHEGGADKNGKLDLDKIKELKIQLVTNAKEPFAFGLDSFGLHKNPPPYKGATVEAFCERSMIQPSQKDFEIELEIKNPNQEEGLELSIIAMNLAGESVFNEKSTVEKKKFSVRAVKIPNKGPQHLFVLIELLENGKPSYRVCKQMACMQPLDEIDAAPNKNSIFGTWVGGGVKELGAKWCRTYVRGTDVSMKDGKLEFKYPVKGIVMPGIYQTLFFVNTPSWLNSEPGRNDGYKYRPNDWDAYGKYIEEVVAETKKHGFTHYEVWNEPVPWAFWMGSIKDVAKLHEITYKAIKKVQPDAIVLGPCPYSFLWDFMDEFFKYGGKDWIDDVVVHAYGSESPDLEFHPNLVKLRKYLDERGMKDKAIYITELGYSTPKMTEKQQAEYLVRAYIYAIAEGVRLVTWHSLWQYDKGDEPGFSIQRYDKSPRPAYTAFSVLIRMLENAKFLRIADSLQGTQRGYVFKKRDNMIWVLWDYGKNPSNIKLELPVQQAKMVDMAGRETDIKADSGNSFALKLSGSPIYIITKSPKE